MYVNEVNEQGSGYGGGFFWGPGGSNGESVYTRQASAGTIDAANGAKGFPTSDFGFQIVCGNPRTCTAPASFDAGSIALDIGETVRPSISAGGLWNAPGWVRGTWPITVSGDSPSGVCAYSASISGDPATVSAEYPANQTVWHQCSSGGLSSTLNTALASDGGHTLYVGDSDAAGGGNGAIEILSVDNQTPTVTLSGPSYASSASGTEEIGVSVATGPSGAYGADCSVDGGPSTFYAGASSEVPVSGVGSHSVTCTGYSNAVSSTGARASSAPASFAIDIQQPTEEAISFSNMKDALRCRTERHSILIRGRRYVIHRHRHRIVVYSRTHRVERRERVCRARTVRRRVLVTLKRHGRLVRVHRTERVVVLPHRVYHAIRTVGFGRPSTVSGLLLLSGGVALADQPVTIEAAPDVGGTLQFAPISSATTNADGVWIARIPAGPSRVLEAVYGGNSIDAGVTSTTVKLSVRARIELSISPRTLPWTGAMNVSGRLMGGYIPADGVALRFLVRYPHSPQRSTLLALRTDAHGRFDFTWSYHGGRGVARYPFSVATTATETDYPFAAASSRRVTVTFGRPTPRSQRPHHRHRDRRRIHRRHRGRAHVHRRHRGRRRR